MCILKDGLGLYSFLSFTICCSEIIAESLWADFLFIVSIVDLFSK